MLTNPIDERDSDWTKQKGDYVSSILSINNENVINYGQLDTKNGTKWGCDGARTGIDSSKGTRYAY